MYILSEYHIL